MTNPTMPETASATRTRHAKDHASMAVVLAAASAAWFLWGHQGGIDLGWLRAGALAGVVVLVVAAVAVRRLPGPTTLAADPAARKAYWISVAAEVALIVLGAVALGATGHGAYLSTWTLLVVGVHFLPFVRPFAAPILRWTAAACALAAGAALAAGLTGAAPAPTVAGAGGGLVLLGSALVILAQNTAGAGSSTGPSRG